jgi:hypothetical protein
MHRHNTFMTQLLILKYNFPLCAVCVVTGVSITCNNESCLHICTEYVDATRSFNTVECVLTLFLVLII